MPAHGEKRPSFALSSFEAASHSWFQKDPPSLTPSAKAMEVKELRRGMQLMVKNDPASLKPCRTGTSWERCLGVKNRAEDPGGIPVWIQGLLSRIPQGKLILRSEVFKGNTERLNALHASRRTEKMIGLRQYKLGVWF